MVKLADYEIEQEAIEFMFIEGTSDPTTRVITLRKIKDLLTRHKRRPFSDSTIEERLVAEIADKGGMAWIEEELDKFIAL